MNRQKKGIVCTQLQLPMEAVKVLPEETEFRQRWYLKNFLKKSKKRFLQLVAFISSITNVLNFTKTSLYCILYAVSKSKERSELEEKTTFFL